jgi:arylsulfatase A-like enzyme
VTTTQRPNILLVTFDQWRADHVGVLGCPLPITPNVDRLAEEGIAFANHYAQCAPCGPSRASMLTGRYLMNHRSVNNGTPLAAEIPNLAECLREAGYDPTLFGYTDTTVDPRTVDDPSDPRLFDWEGVTDGFSVGEKLGTHLEPWVEWLAELGEPYPDAWHALGVGEFEQPSTAHSSLPTPVTADRSPAAFLTQRCIEHIDAARAAGSGPWMVHATYISPHPPWVAPAPYHELIDPADTAPAVPSGGSGGSGGSQHPLLETLLLVPELRAPADAAELAAIRATYAGMIAEVDHQFGRLVEHLRSTGEFDNTLIVLTSDHGEQLGDHGLMHKLGYFAESYHVPLILSWPDGDFGAGVIERRFTENVDLLPTILRAAGVEVPEGVDGAALQVLVHDEEAAARWRTGARWEWDLRDPRHRLPEQFLGLRHDQCSLAVLRDERRQYVHFSGMEAGLGPVYFDLESDPDCTVNLASEAGYAAKVLSAAQALLTWRLQHQGGPLVNTVIDSEGPHRSADGPRP